MKMNSIDTLTRLLAKENITVVRRTAETASFDVGHRILTLPIYSKKMKPVVEAMFLGHEVGHALWTSREDIDFVSSFKSSDFKTLWNIIEDARIERMIKEEYPGIKRTFSEAYIELKEILKIDTLGLHTLSDRINIFFKFGASTGVTFSEKEFYFLKQIDKAKTGADVIRLAKRLFDAELLVKSGNFELARYEAILFCASDDYIDNTAAPIGHGYPELFDTVDRSRDELRNSLQEHSKSKPLTDSEIEDLKNKIEAQKEENVIIVGDSSPFKKVESYNQDLTDTTTEYNYSILNDVWLTDPIVPYSNILSNEKVVPISSMGTKKAKKFIDKNVLSVNVMVKEFEMRKSATLYKRTTISKTGSLDSNKLYSYKTNDDLFRRISVTPDGKNHGMVFLLDWSGSMAGNMRQTIEQLISLVLFCRRIGIPFNVFAFTNGYYGDSEDYLFRLNKIKNGTSTIVEPDSGFSQINTGELGFRLLELFSNKMTNKEFTSMVGVLLTPGFRNCSDFSLCSTPLDTAILYMREFIPKFIAQNNIEKPSLVILTDGASDPVPMHQFDDNLNPYGKNKVHAVRVGKLDYIVPSANMMTEVFIRLLKEEVKDLKVLSFFLTRISENSMLRAVETNSYVNSIKNDLFDLTAVKEAVRLSRRDGVYIVNPEWTNKDKQFIVSTEIFDVSEEDIGNLDVSASAEVISEALLKSTTSRIRSKILLSEFIKEIS